MIRPLAGLATVLALVTVVVIAIGLFQGGFGTTVPVTVISDRAGLVMNPAAKVKMRGVQVGQVESIENRPDGTAVLKLAMDPAQLKDIPGNVTVDIASSTVFGAKSVELVAPPDPSSVPLASGQQLGVQRVTVETNTLFQQLTSVLKAVDPVKLNETLGALASGQQLGVQRVTVETNTLFQQLTSVLKAVDPVKLNETLGALSGALKGRGRSPSAATPTPPPNCSTCSTAPRRSATPWSTRSRTSTDSWSAQSVWPTSATTSWGRAANR